MHIRRRTIIIGLDGVPWGLLQDLAEQGVMPHTQAIIAKGTLKKMQSSLPEVSSVAWSSLITGCNPAEHGIFGFMDFAPGTYRLYFPNFNNLMRPAFWSRMEQRSVILNVPATYPPKEFNGVHISGFVSLDLERSVYPKSLIPKLQELDYRLDVDSAKAHKSFDLFLRDLDKTLKARIEAYRYLWKEELWQVFMLVFTGTDRLMHFLWDAYEDGNHKYHNDFLAHFRQVDEVIGEIFNNIKEEDTFIMLSDHGFERLEKDVYVNYLLKEKGFLKLQDVPEAGFSHIDDSARAFALDPSRIYINLKDKYPRGNVHPQDKEKVLRDLEDLFSAQKMDDRKVFERIYRKEEIYTGPLMDSAPDMVLLGNSGFNLKANIKADRLFDRGIFTGKHTRQDAFLLIRDREIEATLPQEPQVADLVNILTAGG